MPRKGQKQPPRRGDKEPQAIFAWTKPPNQRNVFCWYLQEDVMEPGCVCPTQLRAEGYQAVRDSDTCVTYFHGRTLAS
jgi:hypothetical protein